MGNGVAIICRASLGRKTDFFKAILHHQIAGLLYNDEHKRFLSRDAANITNALTQKSLSVRKKGGDGA